MRYFAMSAIEGLKINSLYLILDRHKYAVVNAKEVGRIASRQT